MSGEVPRNPRISTVKVSVAGFIATVLVLIFWCQVSQDEFDFRLWTKVPNWDARREEVKEAFVISWDAYSKYAWGQDEFHPISKRGTQMAPEGMGWIIVDSLDTMMIMNLTSQLSDARRWVARKLTYDQDKEVNTFETTIRMLGGLLSAHYLSTQLPHSSSRRVSVYLDKSIDLADRLLGAFESKSGLPCASINLKTGACIHSKFNGGSSSSAEASTLQLEMKYLSHLTGNDLYWRKAEKVMKILDDNEMEDGLLPIFVDPETGKFSTSEIRLGSRGDSYYEYLVKQYLQTGEAIYLDMWSQSLKGIQKHMITKTKSSSLQFVAELPQGIGKPLSPKMDHLVCFLPGTIALGATDGLPVAEAQLKHNYWNSEKEEQIQLAKELMKTCYGMYAVTETGLAPEITWFETEAADLQPKTASRPSFPVSSDLKSDWKADYVIKTQDAHNLQRPETVESLFLMYRITNDPIYREWGWEIFKSFQRHSMVHDGEGYMSLNNVNEVPPSRRDNMESFWLAETLKYLYLLFSPPDLLPLDQVVFNTEGHIFPRIQQNKFKTGWRRTKNADA